MENKNDKILLIRHLGRIVSWLKSYVDSFYSRMTEVTDNADRLTAEMHQLNDAVSREEENRVLEENKRRANEEERTRQESTREDNEKVRRLNEEKRIDAEEIRNRNEIAREQAEQERVSTFEGFSKEIASKQPLLTTSEDLAISSENELSLTDLAKMRLFCDLFNEAAGSYGYARITDGKFDCELNGLKLTYEEAVAVYTIYYRGVDQREALAHISVRTNIRLHSQWEGNLIRFAQNNTSLIVANVGIAFNGAYTLQAFYGCSNLRKVLGLSMITGTLDKYMFYGCSKLEYVELSGLRSDMLLQWSPLINLECLQYIVNRAFNSNPITITVHPDVYSKLTGDTTNEAAALLTEEELGQWQAVLTDASANNIYFATV